MPAYNACCKYIRRVRGALEEGGEEDMFCSSPPVSEWPPLSSVAAWGAVLLSSGSAAVVPSL